MLQPQPPPPRQPQPPTSGVAAPRAPRRTMNALEAAAESAASAPPSGTQLTDTGAAFRKMAPAPPKKPRDKQPSPRKSSGSSRSRSGSRDGRSRSGSRSSRRSVKVESSQELADYTKRKVADIVARSNRENAEALAGDLRAAIRVSSRRSYNDCGEDEKAEEKDLDMVFHETLAKQSLLMHTRFVICCGFSSVVLSLVALFGAIFFGTIKKECDEPWFRQEFRHEYSAAPVCRNDSRCGNIGATLDSPPPCISENISCPLRFVNIDHWSGDVVLTMLPNRSASMLLVTGAHRASTRNGINSMQAAVDSVGGELMNSATTRAHVYAKKWAAGVLTGAAGKPETVKENAYMPFSSLNVESDGAYNRQDEIYDYYVHCRRTDVTLALPGTLESFPLLRISTHYGSITLPPATKFSFSELHLSAVKAPLSFRDLRASCPLTRTAAGAGANALGEEDRALSCVSKISMRTSNNPLALVGGTASRIALESDDGPIAAEQLTIHNYTAQSAAAGSPGSWGTVSATTYCGQSSNPSSSLVCDGGITAEVASRAEVTLLAVSGDITLTVYDDFDGTFSLRKDYESEDGSVCLGQCLSDEVCHKGSADDDCNDSSPLGRNKVKIGSEKSADRLISDDYDVADLKCGSSELVSRCAYATTGVIGQSSCGVTAAGKSDCGGPHISVHSYRGKVKLVILPRRVQTPKVLEGQ